MNLYQVRNYLAVHGTKISTLDPSLRQVDANNLLLAYKLAYNIELPQEKCNIHNYWLANVKQDIIVMLEDLNRITPIDPEAISRYAFNIFRVRYSLVFEPLANDSVDLVFHVYENSSIQGLRDEKQIKTLPRKTKLAILDAVKGLVI